MQKADADANGKAMKYMFVLLFETSHLCSGSTLEDIQLHADSVYHMIMMGLCLVSRDAGVFVVFVSVAPRGADSRES